MGKELERRIYKIYINELPLYLTDKKSEDLIDEQYPQQYLRLTYKGNSKLLLQAIDTLEKSGQDGLVIRTSEKVKSLYNDFRKLFPNIIACGGVIGSLSSDKVVMIKRRGLWDLPKGKIEKGEKKKQTAVREVEEETAVKIKRVYSKLIVTRYVFRKRNGTRALKINHWYPMEAREDRKLVPQTNEDITKAEWTSFKKALKKEPMFSSIKDVLLAFKGLS
ncbi:MAG: NUDIX domain-containing protein [Saprospiraceae bacterium]|nr:NUDIX domain-containing protein [Saprospiraceae bacterium]